MAAEKDPNLTLWPPPLAGTTTTYLYDTSAVNLLHWQRITAIRDPNGGWGVDISNSISLTFLYIQYEKYYSRVSGECPGVVSPIRYLY